MKMNKRQIKRLEKFVDFLKGFKKLREPVCLYIKDTSGDYTKARYQHKKYKHIYWDFEDFLTDGLQDKGCGCASVGCALGSAYMINLFNVPKGIDKDIFYSDKIAKYLGLDDTTFYALFFWSEYYNTPCMSEVTPHMVSKKLQKIINKEVSK